MSTGYYDHVDTDVVSGTADLIGRIRAPQDLRELSPDELRDLAEAMREFLIDKVSESGGHLGPNLGVVELTIALHRVFQTPQDQFTFDVSHQCYTHKLLTGRQGEFFRHLRQPGDARRSGQPGRSSAGPGEYRGRLCPPGLGQCHVHHHGAASLLRRPGHGPQHC